MTYELTRKLKDAGFPLKTGAEASVFANLEATDHDHAYFVMPTLSELIEACGESFGTLHKFRRPTVEGAWLACEQTSFEPSGNRSRVGLTPDEAVARLWLALNKKP